MTVKQARVGVDLSQDRMAVKLNVSTNTYRKWEEHPELMPIKAATKFCEITRTELSDIFFATNVK